MKFLKSLMILYVGLIVSSISFAGGSANQDLPEVPDGVEGLGASLLYNNMVDSGFGVSIDYRLVQIETGLTLSASINESVRPNTGNWNQYDIGGYLGYRLPLVSHLFASAGLQGNYGIVTDKSNYNQGSTIDNNPYVFGGYVGLSYEPTINIAIFARVNAIDYLSSGYKDNSSVGSPNKWEFFKNGVVGISYYIV